MTKKLLVIMVIIAANIFVGSNGFSRDVAVSTSLSPSRYTINNFDRGSRYAAEGYLVDAALTDENFYQVFIAARVSKINSIEGSIYRAFGGGLRLYPFSENSPQKIENGRYRLVYQDPIRPYLDLGGFWGRYIFSSLDEFGSQTIESEFFEGSFGLGAAIAITDSLSINIGASYGAMSTAGGVDFTGERISLAIGMTYYN